MEEKEKLFDILKQHEIFKEEIQKKLGRDRAIVYSVYLLENNRIEATFQRVCLVSFKLFPESFSFPEFPEFPDSRVVRNCLWHCVHKSKEWLVGSDKTKYGLTEKGKDIVTIFLKLIKNKMDIQSLPLSFQLKGVTKKELVTKPMDAEVNYIKEIQKSKAYELFIKNKEGIKSIDIKKSLGGDRYSPSSYLRDKLSRATKACEMTDSREVKSYLNWVSNNWSQLMGD